MSYEIRNPGPADEFEYCHCLESWSDEMAESGNHKQLWLERMKSEGLGVKLAVTDSGQYAGMIQYFPERFSPAQSDTGNAWFIQCIWVHGHKKGQGNFQGRGIGKALLEAAIADIAAMGGSLALAWGLTLPFWMKSRWYLKRGFVSAQREGSRELVMKSLDGRPHSASWRTARKTPSSHSPDGRLKATVFLSGACPVSAIAYERLIKAAGNLPVDVELLDSSLPETLEEWGRSDALFIGSKEVAIGPSPSMRKLSRILKRELKRK